MKKIVLFGFICIVVNGCRDEGKKDATASEEQVLPAKEVVLAKAYDPAYEVPEGFFVDARVDTSRSYTLYHVKDPSVSYELCTDDYAEALAWESADNASRAVNGEFITSVETDKYFEIVRELDYPDSAGNISAPTSPGFARVFKCSYINRDGADRNLRNGYAGTLNATPLSEKTIQTYSEYMWQFTFFWTSSKKVLDSYSSDTGSEFQNTLLLVFVEKQGDDQCDLVELVEWEFSVDKANGEIRKSFRPVYQMSARMQDGAPMECID